MNPTQFAKLMAEKLKPGKPYLQQTTTMVVEDGDIRSITMFTEVAGGEVHYFCASYTVRDTFAGKPIAAAISLWVEAKNLEGAFEAIPEQAKVEWDKKYKPEAIKQILSLR